VRRGAARVAAVSRQATLVPGRLAGYAAELGDDGIGAISWSPSNDPWVLEGVEPDDPSAVEAAVALVLALDTINFGSGWHPEVHKVPGCSGAVSMATRLRRWAAEPGRLSAVALAGFSTQDAHRVFEQPHDDGSLDQLMAMFADALSDLGRLVAEEHDGSFTALVATADGSAAALVEDLREMASFDDVAAYDGEPVPILKRAQLAVADLHRGFGGCGPGRFDDVDRLTAFADNLVPHVLRIDGLLAFDPDLVARIDAGEPLSAGSAEEVEIRAVGLHAVELLRAELARQGHDVPSWHLDMVLWQRGGRPAYKAHPRHRARSPYY